MFWESKEHTESSLLKDLATNAFNIAHIYYLLVSLCCYDFVVNFCQKLCLFYVKLFENKLTNFYSLLRYMFDRAGASKVDERLQDALFIMMVANSVINPLIYGTVGRKRKPDRSIQNPSQSQPVATKPLGCWHIGGVNLIRDDWDADLVFYVTKNMKLLGLVEPHLNRRASENGKIVRVTLRKVNNNLGVGVECNYAVKSEGTEQRK